MPYLQITRPDGNIIATSFHSDNILIFNPKNGSPVREFSQYYSSVHHMELLPDGNVIVASTTYNGTILIFNPKNGSPVR